MLQTATPCINIPTAPGTPATRRLRSAALWLLGAVFLTAQPVLAASLNLAWDAVDHPSVAVYEVHYGLASGQYQSSADSTTTSISVSGLAAGTTYFFAVRACDAARSRHL